MNGPAPASDEWAAPRQNNAPLRGWWFPWSVLLCVLAVYAICVTLLHPTNFFGMMEDDSIYFSSAREIALRHGYVTPSLPGHPPATKYPVLYPWLLSWVWRWNPHFPANLAWAVALNVFFGLLFLTAAFVFLRRLKGVGDGGALILTAFCAVHPAILAQSSYLMADMSFAALALMALIYADRAMTENRLSAVACGLLCGCSVLLRTMGVPVAVGILVALLLRKRWRSGLLFVAGTAPFASILLAHALATKPTVSPAVGTTVCADSWRATWLYYTSYTSYWKTDVLSHHVLWPVLQNGIWTTITQPGSYFVDPTGVRPAILAVVLLVVLSSIAMRGLVRLAQGEGWRPAHLALAFYLLPVVLWDYANAERFLIPFLPLLAAGMWTEVRHLVLMVRESIRKQHGSDAKLATVFFCLVGAALLFGTFLSLRKGIVQLQRNSQVRAAMLSEKREAYAWLRDNVAPDAKVVAYEDASLYLYTARRAIRPTIFSPAGYYRPEVLDHELSCLLSSAVPSGADYWLVSSDDFAVEWEPAHSRARSGEREVETAMPLLFASSQHRIRIYALAAGTRQ